VVVIIHYGGSYYYGVLFRYACLISHFTSRLRVCACGPSVGCKEERRFAERKDGEKEEKTSNDLI